VPDATLCPWIGDESHSHSSTCSKSGSETASRTQQDLPFWQLEKAQAGFKGAEWQSKEDVLLTP
jgi:hypothetical protein